MVEPAAAPAANQSGAPAFCTQCGVVIPAMSPGPWGAVGAAGAGDGARWYPKKRSFMGISWDFKGILKGFSPAKIW